MTRTIAILLGFSLGLAAPGQDSIRLRSGASIDGAIVAESASWVSIQVSDGTLQIPRTQIEEVIRAELDADGAAARQLLTLSRFGAESTHHLLYRDGRRVGYRVLGMAVTAVDGVPLYALSDRIVFQGPGGGNADLEITTTEFVDGDLRPRRFSARIGSGLSTRVIEGRVEGGILFVTEVGAAGRQERQTRLPPGAQWANFWARLRSERVGPAPESDEASIFRPRDLALLRARVDLRRDRVMLRGREREVVILRIAGGERATGLWIDASGRVLREELGSSRLVSQWAPAEEVQAYARGEAAGEDLDLELVSEPSGLRLRRPDPTWEVETPDQAGERVFTLLHARHRATLDVFHLGAQPPGTSLEGLALDLLARMRRECEDCVVEGPFAASVGDRQGLQFLVRARQAGTRLVTQGALRMDGGRACLLLAAAPSETFDQARPAFAEMLASFRFLADEPAGAPKDPFAEAGVAPGQ
jgi:hypothetical protein